MLAATKGYTTFKGTMSLLQAKKNEKVKFQWHLKDNTNLELPLKKMGLENVFKLENNGYKLSNRLRSYRTNK